MSGDTTSRPVELAATYRCTECESLVYPVATSRGDGLTCNCTDEEGIQPVVFNLRHQDFPPKWEFDEKALAEEVSP